MEKTPEKYVVPFQVEIQKVARIKFLLQIPDQLEERLKRNHIGLGSKSNVSYTEMNNKVLICYEFDKVN